LLIFKRRYAERGQSVVEFALVLPILVFLLVGIIDLSRIYTTMLSVESAAREGADFGAFGAKTWLDSDHVSKMQTRACVAASNLTDYVGTTAGLTTTCSNPSFDYGLSTDQGNSASWPKIDATEAAGPNCTVETRNPPCWVRVQMTYNFKLLVPLNIQMFGLTLGLPDSLTFTRTSMYAMTDLTPPPTPAP
jgi:Flp pilus assembly protein TadG